MTYAYLKYVTEFGHDLNKQTYLLELEYKQKCYCFTGSYIKSYILSVFKYIINKNIFIKVLYFSVYEKKTC